MVSENTLCFRYLFRSLILTIIMIVNGLRCIQNGVQVNNVHVTIIGIMSQLHCLIQNAYQFKAKRIINEHI